MAEPEEVIHRRARHGGLDGAFRTKEANSVKKQSKAEKIADKRVERAYYATCSGIQINMMDIGKVFAYGRMQIEAGVDDAALQSAIRNYVETIRVG